MDKEKFCITFAGAPGSSKTPIAYHLSYTFNLPIFNHDAIRTEVAEDLLRRDKDEYEKRRDERGANIIKSEISFIYDASVDRRWKDLRRVLQDHGYTWFIISIDLEKSFLEEIYTAKGYTQVNMLDEWIADHDAFLENFGSDVHIHITTEMFHDRLNVSEQAVNTWINR